MSTSAPRRLLLALLALAGCQLFDTRPGVEILPPGQHVDIGSGIDVVVKTDDDVPEALILVDGRVYGEPVQVNRPIKIYLWSVPDGMHTLAARIETGSAPRQSASVPLLVRPPTPSLVSAKPPTGAVDPFVPLTAELTFSEAVSDFTWTASSSLLGSLGATDVDAALSTDRTRLTVRLARPMVEYGWVEFVVDSFGPYRNSSRAWIWWRLPDVTVTFLAPAVDGTWVRGTVPIEATSSMALPGADLLVNGVAVASLGPPPWTFAWDSTSVASGSYAWFGFSSPPWVLNGSRMVWVDSVPPTLLGCHVVAAAQLGVHSCIDAEFSESMWSLDANVTASIGGVPWPEPWTWESSPYVPGRYIRRLCLGGPPPSLPAELAVTFSGADRAGNSLLSPQSCAFALERWWRPWGDGPVSTATASLVGRVSDVAGHLQSWSNPSEPYAGLLLLGGPQDDGLPRQASGTTAEPFRLGEPLIASPPAEFVSDYGAMAWVERTGGPGLAFLSLPANPGPTLLNADPGHDARHPALGDGLCECVAWSEETGSGGRAVRLADWLGPVAGPLGPDPVGVADFPSLQCLGPTVPPSIVNTAPAVAFVDTPPGGVPVVRVAGWDGQAWIPIGGALNVDPARAAGEPLLLYDGSGHWVVFVEADQVIARPWDAALQVWGAPWVLNADPARLAQTPLRKDTVVAFLEAGPAGDEIHVRRWTGSAWELLPGAVNEGVPGAVTSFAVRNWSQTVVAWTDDAGLVRIRFFNE